jgi:6-pyruvoyltetrahydropterin/6-carboxytetrahydropterin synthase
MKAYLTRRYKFPASHRLHLDDASEAENQRVYGKCNNPHGHGHNYALEVTVSGQISAKTGTICDLVALDRFVNREVVERFDHANLNVLPEFAGRVPTTENLCIEIYERLKKFDPARIEKVRLEETRKNSFEIGNVLP